MRPTCLRAGVLLSMALPMTLSAQQPVTPAPAAPAIPPLVPPAKAGDLACDGRDHLPVLIGPTNRAQILEHRATFRDNTAKAALPEALAARWKAVSAPHTIVAVFGSWCGDSQREMPDLLALDGTPSPMVEVRYIGTYRDKKVEAASWPQGIEPQSVTRVPSIFVFRSAPGGKLELVGSVIEHPPKADQRMAEAVLELLEKPAI